MAVSDMAHSRAVTHSIGASTVSPAICVRPISATIGVGSIVPPVTPIRACHITDAVSGCVAAVVALVVSRDRIAIVVAITISVGITVSVAVTIIGRRECSANKRSSR